MAPNNNSYGDFPITDLSTNNATHYEPFEPTLPGMHREISALTLFQISLSLKRESRKGKLKVGNLQHWVILDSQAEVVGESLVGVLRF